MHPAVIKHFMRYPSQLKVVKLLLSNGMCIKNGRVYSGEVEIADTAIARVVDVDRRIVRTAIETIEKDDELSKIFSLILPTTMLKDVASVMNWGCIEIVPSDANEPGILASVASIIAETGISIRQSMVDDPDLTESPKLYVITDAPVPSKIIPTLMECKGVKSLTIH